MSCGANLVFICAEGLTLFGDVAIDFIILKLSFGVYLVLLHGRVVDVQH